MRYLIQRCVIDSTQIIFLSNEFMQKNSGTWEIDLSKLFRVDPNQGIQDVVNCPIDSYKISIDGVL